MSSTLPVDEAPYFNISDPSFAMHSDELRTARDSSWYARTNYGFAILRYAEVTELLKSPQLSQGSAQWPDHHGVTTGSFHDWWTKNLLVLEGDSHHRIRRLLNPAFSPTMAKNLEPAFLELAKELVANFADKGEVEFVSEFSEPYATRALCIMLDLPHSDWEFIAHHANIIGFGLSVQIQEKIDERAETARSASAGSTNSALVLNWMPLTLPSSRSMSASHFASATDDRPTTSMRVARAAL